MKNLKGTDHLGDTVLDRRIILKCILENSVWRCELAQNMIQWRVIVNTVMNLWVL